MNPKRNSRFTVLVIVCLLLFLTGLTGLAQTPPDAKTINAFIAALQQHDTNAAWRLLESHTNLARPVGFGPKLPLLEAAADGDFRVVQRLIELGEDVNAAGDTWLSGDAHMTALEAAAQFGHADICHLLLEKGADPNHRSFSGRTALHFAFWNPGLKAKRNEIIKMLLAHGANPFVEAEYNKTTPFELEITESDGTLIPLMVKAGRARNVAKPMARFLDAHGQAMLSAAARRGELTAVQALLRAGVSATNSTGKGYSLLQTVALAEGSARKAKDFAPERWAKIRQLLQQHGSPYDVFAATGFGDLKAARDFWAANKSIAQARDRKGNSLLNWSVRADHLRLTDFWLAAGTSPAATNLAGQTPLYLAAKFGFTNQVASLLAANAPLNVKATNGLTPFDVAVQAKQTAVIRQLLAKNPPGASPRYGFSTPLHKAAESGNTNLLIKALQTATNVDARSELGFTPFQLAVLHGHLLAATLLLDAGANVNARDAQGDTALQLIMLRPPGYIADLPPIRWYASVRQDPQMTNLFRHLLLANASSQQSALFTAAVFLLASHADAAITNNAGQTAIQLLMSPSVFVFGNERTTLLRLLERGTVATRNRGINARDANGDTALFRAARGLYAGKVDELIAAGANVNATNNQGRTPLDAAVQKISIWPGPLLELLKAGANVNVQDNQGMTPLDVLATSASSFRVQATRALLEAGANPNLQDKQGRTALGFFLSGKWPWSGAGQCIGLLLQAGANPSIRDNQGRTPLFYLAARGNQNPLFFIRNITNYFSPTKVNIEARDDAGDTPLHVAARTGTADVFNWLVREGANLDLTNDAGQTPRLLALRCTNVFARHDFAAQTDIFQAARDGNLAVVSNLLKALPQLLNETNFFGDTPLHLAAMNYRTNVVEFLARKGARWDAVSAIFANRDDVLRDLMARHPGLATNSFNGLTFLHLAAANGQLAVAKLLLVSGANLNAPDIWGLSPLGIAMAHHQSPVVNLFLKRGAKENIFDAVSLGDQSAVKTLLANNKSLALATNRTGLPASAIATALGHTGILKLLLNDDAPLACGGTTLLHITALYNQTNAAALLLQCGAKVEAFDRRGYTPLQLAAIEGSTGMAALLLKHGWFKRGADPNARTRVPAVQVHRLRFPLQAMLAEDTALHLAALFTQTNMIVLLLKSGADVNATNSAGMTPLDLVAPTGRRFPGPPLARRFVGTFPGRGFRLNFEPGILSQPPNPFGGWIKREKAAADLLEKAGAKHGARHGQRPWEPHLIR